MSNESVRQLSTLGSPSLYWIDCFVFGKTAGQLAEPYQNPPTKKPKNASFIHQKTVA